MLCPDANWGSIKIGAGTPPVRVTLGGTTGGWRSSMAWTRSTVRGNRRPCATPPASSSTTWSGRIAFSTARRSRFSRRESDEERKGVVDNVVFPTGLDPRPDLGDHVFDVYYGMGDYAVGAARLFVGEPPAGAT